MAAKTKAAPTNSAALEDGYFGPESMIWKVMSHPAFVIGVQRAAILQAVYPPIAAAVDQHDPVFVRLREHGRYMGGGFDRFRRSLNIPLTAIYGSRAEADAAGAHVRSFHAALRGIEPVSGREYVTSDPDHMLYAGLTSLHSGLVSYEVYGPGRLSEEDRRRFYADAALWLELMGVPSEIIPLTPEDVSAYFDRVNPTLCVTEAGRAQLELLFEPKIGQRLPRDRYALERVALAAPGRLASAAAVVITPRHVRRLVGVDQSVVEEAVLIGLLRPLLSLPGLDEALSRVALGADLARRKRHGQRNGAARVDHTAPAATA
jgi:uncharacterized protein (DUF2236 family)